MHLTIFFFRQFNVEDETNLPFYRMVYNSTAFSYCIFASESVIRNINSNIAIERRNYLMDATFKVVPFGEFKQLLIIHIEYMETVTININI